MRSYIYILQYNELYLNLNLIQIYFIFIIDIKRKKLDTSPITKVRFEARTKHIKTLPQFHFS